MKTKEQPQTTKLQKWNYKTKEYEDFDSPATTVILMTDDMEQIVQCANCGNELKYGEAYTSRTIHTQFGLGYPVCEKCYQVEWEQEKKEGRP